MLTTLATIAMGKKAPSKTTAAKAGAGAPKISTAAGKAPAEEGSGHQTGDWAKSLIAEKDICYRQILAKSRDGP